MLNAGITTASKTMPASFRYRPFDDDYLITNPFGDWCWLRPSEFKAYVEGTLDTGAPAYQSLCDANLIQNQINDDGLIERLSAQKSFLRAGPTLHNISISDIDETTLSIETGQRIIDTAFMSTAETLAIEFDCGTETPKEGITKDLISYARRKNEIARKDLKFTLRCMPAALNTSLSELLVEEKMGLVLTCILHPDIPAMDQNTFTRISEHVANSSAGGTKTLTEICFGHSERTVLDSCLGDLHEAGCNQVWIRPLDAFDALQHGVHPVVPSEAMIEACVHAILGLLGAHSEMVELYSATLLQRMLSKEEGHITCLRNPAMDGIGSFAYDAEGAVYTSARGRLLGHLGDPGFLIGSVHRSGYHDLIVHPTVRSIVMASTLEGQPGWATHAYTAYCGTDPVLNYLVFGSIHGRMQECDHARWQMALLDRFFQELKKGDAGTCEQLHRWASHG